MDNKIALYEIRNVDHGQVWLMEIGNTNMYQIIEFGEFIPILDRGSYLLFEEELAMVFQKYVPEEILFFEKVKIFRRSTNEEWDNYVSIVFKKNVELNDFRNLDSSGLKVYSFQYQNIYISKELKNLIIQEYKDSVKLNFINEAPINSGVKILKS